MKRETHNRVMLMAQSRLSRDRRIAAEILATDAEVKRLRRENKALRARLGVVTVKFDKRRGYTFDTQVCR